MVEAAVGCSHSSASAGVYPPLSRTVSTFGSIRTVRFPPLGVLSDPRPSTFSPFKWFNCLAYLGLDRSTREVGPAPKLTIQLIAIDRRSHGPRVYDRVKLEREDGVDRVRRACRRAHRLICAKESALEAVQGGTTCPRCVKGGEEVLVAVVAQGERIHDTLQNAVTDVSTFRTYALPWRR